MRQKWILWKFWTRVTRTVVSKCSQRCALVMTDLYWFVADHFPEDEDKARLKASPLSSIFLSVLAYPRTSPGCAPVARATHAAIRSLSASPTPDLQRLVGFCATSVSHGRNFSRRTGGSKLRTSSVLHVRLKPRKPLVLIWRKKLTDDEYFALWLNRKNAGSKTWFFHRFLFPPESLLFCKPRPVTSVSRDGCHHHFVKVTPAHSIL